jgi:Tfp pilus assembly protein PilZ
MPDGTGIELLDKVKAMSPDLPIVMFVTGFADITVEDVFDKGADAIFSKPFDRKLVLEAIKKALTAKEEYWRQPEAPQNVETDFQIKITFADLGMAIETRALNLGRGGMFVALKDIFPAVSEKATFTIQFNHGSPLGVSGRGEVKWVRTHSTSLYPSGCGIEFTYLNDDTRTEVVNYIQNARMRSYIPKN